MLKYIYLHACFNCTRDLKNYEVYHVHKYYLKKLIWRFSPRIRSWILILTAEYNKISFVISGRGKTNHRPANDTQDGNFIVFSYSHFNRELCNAMMLHLLPDNRVAGWEYFQSCVCHSVFPHKEIPMWPLQIIHWASLYTAFHSHPCPLWSPRTTDQASLPVSHRHQAWDPSPVPALPLLLTSDDHNWKLFKCIHSRIPRATSGRDHWSTYGLQTDDTQPSGMLSC